MLQKQNKKKYGKSFYDWTMISWNRLTNLVCLISKCKELSYMARTHAHGNNEYNHNSFYFYFLSNGMGLITSECLILSWSIKNYYYGNVGLIF